MNGQFDRALKHFIINAKFGCSDSLEGVRLLYKDGYASKDDFYAALRDYQTAIEATKSPQREEAAECEEWANKMRGI